jgi:hypothetical protein
MKSVEIRDNDLFFDLSPIQSKFVHSDANIVQLKGPMGEGKTYCGGVACVRHAQRAKMAIRGALIRDTHTNIEISTIISLKETFGSYVSFHKDNRVMKIRCNPEVEMDLFGIDDPASLSRLQGPLYSFVWIEEPAPIIDRANAGVSEDVFRMCVARAARQSGAPMRVQITQNPAEETHWTEMLANAPYIYEQDVETGDVITKKTFDLPYGENKYLNKIARLANKAAFKNDPGKWTRYVEGRAAPVYVGKKVTTGYISTIHFSKTELPVVPNCIGVRFWDGWHHPACIIGQIVPPGRLIIHTSCQFEDGSGGVVELIAVKVNPILNSRKYKNLIPGWRDIGDPSMATPDQSSRSTSAAKKIEELLDGARFEPGPALFQHRLPSTNVALGTNSPDGSGPLILLSSTAYSLHRALNGGWHWKTDNSGKIIGTIPEKGPAADLADAFCYGVSTIFPHNSASRVTPEERKALAAASARIARSYASGWSSNLRSVPLSVSRPTPKDGIDRFRQLRRY